MLSQLFEVREFLPDSCGGPDRRARFGDSECGDKAGVRIVRGYPVSGVGSRPLSVAGRRMTIGVIMDTNPYGGVPPALAATANIVASSFARPRVRGLWKADRLRQDGKALKAAGAKLAMLSPGATTNGVVRESSALQRERGVSLSDTNGGVQRVLNPGLSVCSPRSVTS